MGNVNLSLPFIGEKLQLALHANAAVSRATVTERSDNPPINRPGAAAHELPEPRGETVDQQLRNTHLLPKLRASRRSPVSSVFLIFVMAVSLRGGDSCGGDHRLDLSPMT